MKHNAPIPRPSYAPAPSVNDVSAPDGFWKTAFSSFTQSWHTLLALFLIPCFFLFLCRFEDEGISGDDYIEAHRSQLVEVDNVHEFDATLEGKDLFIRAHNVPAHRRDTLGAYPLSHDIDVAVKLEMQDLRDYMEDSTLCSDVSLIARLEGGELVPVVHGCTPVTTSYLPLDEFLGETSMANVGIMWFGRIIIFFLVYMCVNWLYEPIISVRWVLPLLSEILHLGRLAVSMLLSVIICCTATGISFLRADKLIGYFFYALALAAFLYLWRRLWRNRRQDFRSCSLDDIEI